VGCRPHIRVLAVSALDALAVSAGVRRIGSFVSDDDFFDCSDPEWHAAADALATFETLLARFPNAPPVRATRPVLESIRDRLRVAAERDAQFCLLVRTAPATNATEWAMRKGYP
jgi:hypothetical protein